MTLWTMQPVSVYEEIKEHGVYRADAKKITTPEFLKAYDWLCDKLAEKCPRLCNVQYPVWAWYKFNGKHKKPDLRHSCYGVHGQEMAAMEVEVPDDQVLLSDFELWHSVLNKAYLAMTESEYSEFYETIALRTNTENQMVKEKSWNNIFNIPDEPYEDDWIRYGAYVQAIFWELKAEYIKHVQFFTAR